MLAPFIIAAIGLVCGLIIYVVYVKMPIRVEGIEKTEELSAILPGMNCGACGYPGCFGLAQALTKNPDMISRAPCAILLQDTEGLTRMGEALGQTIDAAAMQKRALIHCSGDSDIIYHYSGVNSCKAADQLLSGYRKCPYACLGLGDCAVVCPQDAISIDPESHTASVDWEKCTGCGLCIAECPKNLIELVSAATKIAFRCSYAPLRNIPGREKCQSGCIHCRKCLNACETGAITWNKEKAIPEFDPDKCTLCLNCIEACPNSVLANTVNAPEPDKVAA